MATPLPVAFRVSPLPPDFRGTPQAFMEAIVERLSLDTLEQLALITIGPVAPTSDIGPWLKNGTTWYVWDAGTGAYVPQTFEFLPGLNPKPFRADSAGAQDIVFAGPSSETIDLVYNETYDPDGVYDTNVFTADADGYFTIMAKMAISVTAGTPTDNTILFFLKKNGIQMPAEQVFDVVGDVTAGRTYQICTEIQLNAADEISVAVGVEVGGGSGTWTVTQGDTWFAGHKVRNLTFGS
jgi:hypothetical protein